MALTLLTLRVAGRRLVARGHRVRAESLQWPGVPGTLDSNGMVIVNLLIGGEWIGTALLILIPEWLRFLKSVPGLYLAIYGLAVILIIRYMPDGIWGFVNTATARWRAQLKAPAAAPPAAPGSFLAGRSDARR